MTHALTSTFFQIALIIGAWFVAYGIFTGVRFLIDSFRATGDCWDGYAHGGDNTPRGLTERDGANHE